MFHLQNFQFDVFFFMLNCCIRYVSLCDMCIKLFVRTICNLPRFTAHTKDCRMLELMKMSMLQFQTGWISYFSKTMRLFFYFGIHMDFGFCISFYFRFLVSLLCILVSQSMVLNTLVRVQGFVYSALYILASGLYQNLQKLRDIVADILERKLKEM